MVAPFHVDPQHLAVRGRERGQPLEAGGRDVGPELEPEVRGLDRDLGIEAPVRDLAEQGAVLVHPGARLGLVGEVLAEHGEHAADPLLLERFGGGERRRRVLAGHEATHRPPDERMAGDPLLEPGIVGRPEQRVPEDAQSASPRAS